MGKTHSKESKESEESPAYDHSHHKAHSQESHDSSHSHRYSFNPFSRRRKAHSKESQESHDSSQSHRYSFNPFSRRRKAHSKESQESHDSSQSHHEAHSKESHDSSQSHHEAHSKESHDSSQSHHYFLNPFSGMESRSVAKKFLRILVGNGLNLLTPPKKEFDFKKSWLEEEIARWDPKRDVYGCFTDDGDDTHNKDYRTAKKLLAQKIVEGYNKARKEFLTHDSDSIVNFFAFNFTHWVMLFLLKDRPINIDELNFADLKEIDDISSVHYGEYLLPVYDQKEMADLKRRLCAHGTPILSSTSSSSNAHTNQGEPFSLYTTNEIEKGMLSAKLAVAVLAVINKIDIPQLICRGFNYVEQQIDEKIRDTEEAYNKEGLGDALAGRESYTDKERLKDRIETTKSDFKVIANNRSTLFREAKHAVQNELHELNSNDEDIANLVSNRRFS